MWRERERKFPSNAFIMEAFWRFPPSVLRKLKYGHFNEIFTRNIKNVSDIICYYFLVLFILVTILSFFVLHENSHRNLTERDKILSEVLWNIKISYFLAMLWMKHSASRSWSNFALSIFAVHFYPPLNNITMWCRFMPTFIINCIVSLITYFQWKRLRRQVLKKR